MSGRKPGVDRHTVEITLHEVQQSGWSLVYYLQVVLWIAGVAALAIGVSRYSRIPPYAGALLALGALMVGTESGITSNVYFIASSAVWLAGGIAVGSAIARMSDAEFAGE